MPMESGLDNQSINHLFYRYGTLHTFPKDSFVFMKDETPVASYLIEEGILKICQLTDSGQNITFFIRKPGDAFGLAEIILNSNHPCYAQCLQECRIWELKADTIRTNLSNNPSFSDKIMKMMANRLLYHQYTVELLTSKSVAERLSWFLSQICLFTDGKWRADLTLTHEDISNVIGASRQTVTEILRKWKMQEKIEYDRKKIIILDDQFFQNM